LTSDARADLDSIWAYVAERSSPDVAAELLCQIEDAFVSLADNPSMGIRFPNAPKPDTRKFPMGNFLIYYQPKRGGVCIERVIHGKRHQFRALRHRPK
jgi:toxin ParE1/3/4